MLLLLLGCVAGARVRFAGRVCSFFLVPVDYVCVHSFSPCVCLIIVFLLCTCVFILFGSKRFLALCVCFFILFGSVRVCSFFLALNAFWLCACFVCVFSSILFGSVRGFALFGSVACMCVHSFWLFMCLFLLFSSV